MIDEGSFVLVRGLMITCVQGVRRGMILSIQWKGRFIASARGGAWYDSRQSDYVLDIVNGNTPVHEIRGNECWCVPALHQFRTAEVNRILMATNGILFAVRPSLNVPEGRPTFVFN